MEKDKFVEKVILYYFGDPELHNPMRTLVEKKYNDRKTINHIYKGLKGELAQEFMEYDLMLNHQAPIGEDIDYHSISRHILQNDSGLRMDKYVSNFFEADLLPQDFPDFGVDTYRFNPENKTSRRTDKIIDKIIVSHKDFPQRIRKHLYELSGDEDFLPEDAKEMFLF